MGKKIFTDESLATFVDETKSYVNSATNKLKDDLLNGAGDAYDTLKELGDLIGVNVDAIDALEIVAAGKADKEHVHDIYETKEDAQTKYDNITEAKADWNQNDETDIDYVKNRTHWISVENEILLDEIIVEENYVQITELDNVAFWDSSMEFLYDKLIITFDNVEYELNAFMYDSRPYWGDSRLIGEDYNTIDVPFLLETNWGYEGGGLFGEEIPIWFISFNESIAGAPHTIKIEAATGEIIYHQLDEKFIPDTIARVSDVEERFALKSDLNNIDLSAYETKEEVEAKFDEHKADTSLHFTSTEKTKLSGIESGAQKNTIIGVKGDSESSYRTGNVNITKANIGLGNVDNTSDANKPVSMAQQTAIDNSLASAKEYTDDKIGLLMNNSSEAVDSIMELATAMEENADVIEALTDAVAGHTHSFNDLNDKPFGEEIVENEIINTTLNFIAAESLDNIYFAEDFTSAYFTKGMTYKVDWNGEQYVCVALDGGGDYVYIGNYHMSPDWELAETIESNEPFFIVINSDFSHSLVSTSSNTPVTLKVMEMVEAVRQIDEKYIPDTIARQVDIESELSKKANSATTLSGYGIADAYTKTQIDSTVSTLNTAISGKANATHSHAISDVTNLQTELDKKANTSDLTSHTDNKSNPHGVTLAQLGVTADATELNYVDGVTSNIQTQLNKKADDYSIELYNGTSGNPKPVKFMTVNYSTCGSENGVAIKVGMVSGHGNGSSYAFLQDAIIKVSYTGGVEVDNFKYYGATTTLDGTRQFGDIFWTIDTTNKIVDFYCLMGQYARLQMIPYKRVTYSTGGTITQYTSCTVYSSGEKVWANNSDIALLSDIDSKSDKTTINVDATSGAKSLTFTTSNSNNEWRYVYASGISSITFASSGTFSNNVEAFYSVVFKSGTTATTITNALGIYFTGDDCVDGTFTPSTSKSYDLGVWYNGLSWQAVVRGV